MSSSWPTKRRNTVLDLQAAKDRNEKWAMLTSYDALTAGIFDECEVRALLVGDSAAMTVLGHDTTLPVTLDEMVCLAGGVVRGTKRSLVVGDMPFGSYQASVSQAVESATRFFKEAGVQAVKVEGGRSVVHQVRAISSAGMPVMGHVGLTPQSVNALGGHRVQGRGDAAARLLDDARELESAGAFAVVLEAVPASVAEQITNDLTIPTVGIGAGADCDAQILVWQDMAGLTDGHVPRFVKRYTDMRGALSEAVTSYVDEVRNSRYPAAEHTYE